MKSFFRLLLMFVCVMSPLLASAYDFELNGVYYMITSPTDKTCSITYNKYNDYQTSVNIPATVSYNSVEYKVTGIGNNAFRNCSTLTEIRIPATVTSVGSNAFYGCTGVKSLVIEDCETVLSLSNNQFASCSLDSVYVGRNLSYSSGYAPFNNLKTLKTVEFGGRVTSLGYGLFEGCESLSSAKLNSQITSLGNNAFIGCTSLASLDLPKTLEKIGNNTFNNCPSLTGLAIPSSVTSIGSGAFSGCSGLKSLVIEDGETTLSLSSSQFASCGLETVYLGRNLSYSADYSEYAPFYNQKKLKTVETGANVTSLGYALFRGCESLSFAKLNSKITSLANHVFSGCSSLSSLTLPKTLTKIGDNTFLNCSSLDSLTIPSSVVSIGSSAFSGCSGIKVLVIEDGETTLSLSNGQFTSCVLETAYLGRNLSYSTGSSEYAPFYNQKKLKTVETGANVTSLGYALFRGCESLSSVKLNSKISSLANYVFYGCSSLSSLTLPKTLTKIGDNTFLNCSSLDSLTIPSSVVSIGSSAFSGCSGIKVLVIEDGETTLSLSNGQFTSCSLETIYLGRNLSYGTSDSSYAPFYNQKKLKTVELGDKVTSLGYALFRGCESIESINLTPNIKSINNYAFGYCPSLSDVFIPAYSNLTTISSSAFSNSPNVSFKIVLTDLESWCSNTFNVNLLGTRHLILDGKEITDCVIPSGVTTIGANAFRGCAIESLTLPNSVTSIGTNAFYDCKIKSVTVGTGLTSIETNAFNNKPTKTIWLTNTPPSGYAQLNGTVNYVSNDQFSSLSNVKKYQYLSSMFEVDGVKYAIISPSERICDAIDCRYDSTAQDIVVDKIVNYRNIKLNVNNVNPYTFYNNKHIQTASLGNANEIGSYAFWGCSNVKSAFVADGIVSIGSYAFRGCSSLQGITIPNSVTSLGSYAFQNCSALDYAFIGNKTERLNDYVFDNCSALREVTICDGVSAVGAYAFQNCATLPEITIPGSVKSIGNYTFNGCTSLSDVVFSDRTEALGLGSNGSSPLFSSCPLDSVYIGGKLSYSTSSSYGYSPFYRNLSLRTVYITDKEEEIYANEFYGCSSLQTMKIGDGVKKIGNWAFSGCSMLESFAFGTSLQSIGQEAFSDCSSMAKIVSEAAVPPTCGNQALDDVNKWDCILFVPAESIEAYYAADQWKDFFFVDSNSGMTEDDPSMHQFDLRDGQAIATAWERQYATVTYTRNFKNTSWQPLYLPISMEYKDWNSQGLEVARLNGFYEYDDDKDGTVDRSSLEVLLVTENDGRTLPNHPYLVRAKQASEKVITLKDAKVYPTEANHVDCSTVETSYTFIGTYNQVSQANLNGLGAYVMSGGSLKQSGSALNPMRWYVVRESRGSQMMPVLNEIKVFVQGEEDEADALDFANEDTEKGQAYNLMGQKVSRDASGIKIISGRKYVK